MSETRSHLRKAAPLEIVPERTPCTGHWLEVVSHLDAKYGGVSAVVPQVSARMHRAEGISVSIAAFCEPGEFHAVDEFPELSLSDWPTSRASWIRTGELRRRFRKFAAEADGLHIHGLWSSSTSVASRTARALKLPYVISAHGMLEPWALAHNGFKKRLYAALTERANVHAATCMHALTQDEALDYRRFGCKQPIAIIPNGVNIPRSVDATEFLRRFPDLEGKRIVIFLARLHMKKGLDVLLQSWRSIAAKFPDARLVIAGPDSDHYLDTLTTLVARYEIADSVVFTGMLAGSIKWSALANATGFVLPSYSEGFSVAALEAMGMGLPVIVSDNCHLPEVQSAGAGWIVRAEAESLQSALAALLQNADADNAEIGNRGRRMVLDQYNWQRVAHQMAELYRYVQGGPKPQSFELQEAQT